MLHKLANQVIGTKASPALPNGHRISGLPWFPTCLRRGKQEGHHHINRYKANLLKYFLKFANYFTNPY